MLVLDHKDSELPAPSNVGSSHGHGHFSEHLLLCLGFWGSQSELPLSKLHRFKSLVTEFVKNCIQVLFLFITFSIQV